MRRQAQNVLYEALILPDDERAEIAGALLESLGPAPEAEVETAWRFLSATQEAALARLLSQSHHLGGRAPSRDELHER